MFNIEVASELAGKLFEKVYLWLKPQHLCAVFPSQLLEDGVGGKRVHHLAGIVEVSIGRHRRFDIIHQHVGLQTVCHPEAVFEERLGELSSLCP